MNGESRRAVVLGCGRSGRAAETLLRLMGFESAVLDGEMPFPSGEFGLAVVSPGIALTHPWIAEAKRRGIPLKSELHLGCEELKRRGWKLLAVTGSKGKSSVVKLVADAIGLAGGHAVPCGNYGLPVSEVATARCAGCNRRPQNPTSFPPTSPWAIVEVSSFMMETTELPEDTFEAAAILNLQEDHLDRHGSVEVYHALKRRLLTMTKRPMEEAGPFPGRGSRFPILWKESYFDNEILSRNAAIAVELMRVAGLSDETIRRAFAAFQPLPHRMNTISEIGGVRYIDDSKATSIAALVAGVKMAGKGAEVEGLSSLFLIAGGLPKGDDPKIAIPTLTEWVKKVYLIGRSAATFFDAWRKAVDCEICDTLDKAVESARREATAGETVLLSPGAASFDQFKSFGERGDVFARLVKEKENDK